MQCHIYERNHHRNLDQRSDDRCEGLPGIDAENRNALSNLFRRAQAENDEVDIFFSFLLAATTQKGIRHPGNSFFYSQLLPPIPEWWNVESQSLFQVAPTLFRSPG